MKAKIIKFEPNLTQANAVVNFVHEHNEFNKLLQEKAKEIANAKTCNTVQSSKVR